MPRVCVFDVNETLLDLGALDPHFQRVFGDAAVQQVWFTQVIQSSLVATVTGFYTDFGTIGGAALDMVASRYGVVLPAADRQQILSTMHSLPPHSEVRESLEQLRDAGLRLAALTNSAQQMAEAQLNNAGLADLFEQILSVEAVQRYKPVPEVYEMAALRLGVSLAEIRLIAAHEWDVAGALRAGCAAAFVARPGKVLDPLYEPPDIVGADLRNVAAQIIAIEGVN